MKVEAYLNYDGRCDEAIEFYKGAVGAKVTMLMRFKDMPTSPGNPTPTSDPEKVMHANLLMGDTHVLMSDGRCMGKGAFFGVSLALSVANDEDARRIFEALGEGGQITMPMGKTFFSSSFGMLTDKFGVAWMILVEH